MSYLLILVNRFFSSSSFLHRRPAGRFLLSFSCQKLFRFAALAREANELDEFEKKLLKMSKEDSTSANYLNLYIIVMIEKQLWFYNKIKYDKKFSRFNFQFFLFVFFFCANLSSSPPSAPWWPPLWKPPLAENQCFSSAPRVLVGLDGSVISTESDDNLSGR